MIQVKHIKKVTSFLLILVTALLLVACSKKENVPYGSINLESNYLRVGKDSVTEKEVYDTLRKQSGSVLPKLIEEKLFESYKTTANDLLAADKPLEGTDAFWAQEEFDKLVNTKIFSTDDVDNIKDMSDLRRKVAVEKYADSIFDDAKVSKKRSELVDIIYNFLIENSEDYATGYYNETVFKNLYLIEIQKKLYAKDELAKDIKDEDSTNYIKEKDVVTYYKNNVKKQLDVNAFFFPFLSTNEANAALRMVGIKSNSRGHWFEIPDIRLVATREADEYQSEDHYLWTVLENTNLKNKFNGTNPDGITTDVTDSEFKEFYESYSPTEARDSKLSEVHVLAKFVEAYNAVNASTKQLKEIDTSDESLSVLNYKLEYKNGETYKTNYSYDDITDVSSTLRNYIYDSLTVEKPYSTLRSIGNLRYLVFKLDENYNELNFVSEEKDEDDNEKFVAAEELKAILEDDENDKKEDLLAALKDINKDLDDKILDNNNEVNVTNLNKYINSQKELWEKDLIDTKLTSSYVTTKVNALYESDDTKVEIYDKVMSIFFNQSAKAEAKYKASKDNDTLLKATFKLNDEKVEIVITVSEYYALVEPIVGLETALDLLLNKLLIKEYETKDGMFKDDEIKEKDFKKEFKDMISGFSSDQFAQAGYPASMGRETFMLLLFGSSDQKEAIKLGYLVPKLRELFLEKENNFLGNDVNINEVFADFAAKQYNQFKGVQVSHLLVYFDEDGDGTPENPNEYFEKLTEAEKNEVLDAIVEIYGKIIDLLGDNGAKDLSSEKFNAIVTKFQESARIPLDTYYEELGNDKFAWMQKARKFGLNIKFENISSEITNTSNFITASSTLDPVFYNRAIALRDLVEKVQEENKKDETYNKEYKDLLPYFDFGFNLNEIKKGEVEEQDTEGLFSELTTSIVKDELMSDFGFHFILVDSISDKTEAKYNASDDSDNKYVDNDNKDLNAYNTEVTLSKTQIEYYLKNKNNSEGVLLPSNVRTAISKYFDPVYSIYTHTNTKNHLVYKYLDGKTLVFKDNNAKAKFQELVEINLSTLHGYQNGKDEANYDNLYNGLFEALGINIVFNK